MDLEIPQGATLALAFKRGVAGAASGASIGLRFDGADASPEWFRVPESSSAGWEEVEWELSDVAGRRLKSVLVRFEGEGAPIPYAIKLGVALQMTNILRDVGEDFQNGRLYLPREELAFYGVREQDIADGRVTENWRQFMKFQIERTRQLYDESWEGVKMLEREGQLAIGAASVFYRGILDEIEKNDYDVFTQRANLSALGKLSKVPALWLKIKTL